MQKYLDLLNEVLTEGEHRTDRTGTDTISLFGTQTRYDLREGFPLITTKKMFWKGIVTELLWFLKGDTNIKYLNDHGVHIWDAWADSNGNLGPVYGKQWVKWNAKVHAIAQPKPVCRVKPTYLGVANGKGKQGHPLCKTWEGMIARCYNPKHRSYAQYGGRGVHVDNSWLQFENFAEDAAILPGFLEKHFAETGRSKNVRYVLDKDSLGNGFRYGPDTCQWVSDTENANLKLTTAKGAVINQIQQAIDQIKNTPDSRRIIVSAWNVAELDLMALPPCHVLFQFYVSGMYLDLQLYQRSADLFLGAPFNIASYSLLLSMVAHVTGLLPRYFIHTIGDAHIYTNHIEQVKEQLTREPLPLPGLAIAPFIDDINKFNETHIIVGSYTSHPAIKAPISV